MRWFFLSFLLATLGAAAGEPGDVALDFLRDLDKSKIKKRLAISPFCGPEKLKRIERLWENRAMWTKSGSYRFSSIDEKVEGDLAAVLIGAVSPDGPDAAGVVTLGLVRKGDQWLVSPVEGSFDNAGLGFGAEIKSRVRGLETWMASRKVGGLVALRRSEMDRFRKELESQVPAEQLQEEDSRVVLNHFLKAAEEGNADALIVWQGFLERDELPERDWDQHMRATRLGLRGKDRQNVWRILSSKKVLRQIVEGNGDTEEAEYLVGFLSSYEVEPRDEDLNPIRFTLLKTGNGWRVKLPTFFSHADEDSRSFATARRQDFDWEDRRGVRNMFFVFEEENPKIRLESPEALLKSVVEDLSSGGLHAFLCRHYREIEEPEPEEEEGGDDDDDAEDELEEGGILPNNNVRGRQQAGGLDDRRLGRYREMVKWWGEALETRDTLKAKVARLYVEGDYALGVLSVGSSNHAWKPNYETVWMTRGEGGWMLLPGVDAPMSNCFPSKDMDKLEALENLFADDLAKMEKDFLSNVLKVVGVENPKGTAASEEDALELVQNWRQIAREGEMMALLKNSALRQLPDKPTKLLSNLGHVRKGAGAATRPDQILGSKAVGRYRGVSLMIDSGRGSEMSCPLVLVVPSGDSHRVLVDIELPLEINKGVRLMNDLLMDDLSKELKKEDLASIEELRKWHQGISRPVWETWNREKSAGKE